MGDSQSWLCCSIDQNDIRFPQTVERSACRPAYVKGARRGPQFASCRDFIVARSSKKNFAGGTEKSVNQFLPSRHKSVMFSTTRTGRRHLHSRAVRRTMSNLR